MNYFGRVIGASAAGYYVEMNRSGQVGKFGPMLSLAFEVFDTTDAKSYITVPPLIGDTVLVTTVGKVADQFCIVGKVNDPNNPKYNQEQNPYGDGTTV